EETAVPPTPVPEVEATAEPEVVIPGPVELQSATVQIYAKFETRGQLQTNWTGSGTIVSADGLILTNAHVASPLSPGLAALYNEPEFIFGDEPDALVVGLVESADLPPVETYLAEVRAADGVLDLAVIQITETVDGQPVDADSLNLPFVNLGDSDLLNLGDEIQVYGFPGAGGDTITFTRGDVSGFESEDRVGTRAWIKTDTTFSPGNSGGLGANAQGEVVGVPSFTLEAAGGSINRLRSVNLAKPLIDAAHSGSSYESPYVVAGTGSESLELVTWAEDFDSDTSCAISPVSAYAAGTPAAVAVFAYKGMADGEQFAVAWFLEDELLFADIFSWEYGKSGDCFAVYIHNQGDPIDTGMYEVELYAGQELDLAGSATVAVGGTAVAAPSGGVQVDGVITDADSGKPIREAVVFVLNPGVDLDAWLDDPSDADVYAFAETNAQGEFELSRLLERGVEYPAIAGKEGFRPNDGFLFFEADDPDFITLELTLSR
ncbi:MAG: trypsin-like peptidase domain-containing protein, partial [Anaerolineales bacterium]|nr:trypsin-like peptidase domain-containing protein [Anaerolineales bacterium]